jgi:hypothetical protein
MKDLFSRDPLKGSGPYWRNEFSICAIPVKGGRYEDTCVDRCTAFGGVALGSANVTHATAIRRWRPDKIRYSPGGVSAGQRIVQLTNNKRGAP